MKVAVTSSDGRKVDTEFRKAEEIYVYNLENNHIMQVEKRQTNKYSIHNRNQSFGRNSFERIYETIKDCDVTYTQCIGDIPRQRCLLLGVEIKLAEGDIKRILGVN